MLLPVLDGKSSFVIMVVILEHDRQLVFLENWNPVFSSGQHAEIIQRPKRRKGGDVIHGENVRHFCPRPQCL
ncbi:MAG: hypothetical protein RIQ93_539, partial [Verrucomicrobiota bacterium]